MRNRGLLLLPLALLLALTGSAHEVSAAGVSPQAIVGTWNWVDGQTIVLDADGTGTWFKAGTQINEGRWELLDPAARRYRFILKRGGYVDTVVLSPDGNAIDGKNNEGLALHGTRVPGAPTPSGSIVGTWNWVDGQTIVLDADGTGTWFKAGTQINEGRWELLDPVARRYRFVLKRGGYVDTVVLSPDGNAIDGKNNEGLALHGTRVSGGPTPSASIVGTWNWVDGQTIVLDADGTGTWFKAGTQINEGRWELLDPAARRYRFVLKRGGYVDTVVLSPDGNAIDGRNNEGLALHGTRAPGQGGR